LLIGYRGYKQNLNELTDKKMKNFYFYGLQEEPPSGPCCLKPSFGKEEVSKPSGFWALFPELRTEVTALTELKLLTNTPCVIVLCEIASSCPYIASVPLNAAL
jgi:hypothetical protein